MALNLYRRHRKECEGSHPEDTRTGQFEEGRRGWKKCACLIHVSGTLGGQLQADQQWINSQLSPKEQGFFAVGLVAPSLLIDGNPRAYLLPFIAAYGNEVENYTNEFNTVYDVTAAAKP